MADLITVERKWNVEMLNELCTEKDIRLILSIPLSENELPDRQVWSPSPREFTR